LNKRRKLNDFVVASQHAALSLMLAVLAACSPTGEGGAKRLCQYRHHGRQLCKGLPAHRPHRGARSLADYRGKVVTLFFGYTQCPDVCPTNLLGMAEVMRQLGPDADKVQVLFITVDPERDTQALLAEYVPAFDRASPVYTVMSTTAAVARDFKVFYQKQGDVPRAPPTRWIIPPAPTCSIRRGACACT
jgi:protein SCO1/2